MHQLKNYLLLMRMHRPIGSLLLLWPTLWALWLAGQGQPQLSLVIIFSLGVLVTRSLGCVLNDYADRHFDGAVARTQNRPLVTGAVSPQQALFLAVVLALLALGLVLLLNPLARWLAIVAATLMIIYPFMKRITQLPQVILGFAFAWGIPMAFAAQTGRVPALAWLILLATALWIVMYDTLYAMADRPDDVRIGIKSTAILFGEHDRLIIAGLQLVTLLVFLLIGKFAALNQWYFLAIVLVAGFFIYQQVLIKTRDREKCLQAFLNNNWVGVVIFFGVLAGLIEY